MDTTWEGLVQFEQGNHVKKFADGKSFPENSWLVPQPTKVPIYENINPDQWTLYFKNFQWHRYKEINFTHRGCGDKGFNVFISDRLRLSTIYEESDDGVKIYFFDTKKSLHVELEVSELNRLSKLIEAIKQKMVKALKRGKLSPAEEIAYDPKRDDSHPKKSVQRDWVEVVKHAIHIQYPCPFRDDTESIQPDDIPIYHIPIYWYEWDKCYHQFSWYESEEILGNDKRSTEGYAIYLSNRVKLLVSFATFENEIIYPVLYLLAKYERAQYDRTPHCLALTIGEVERLSFLLPSVKVHVIDSIRLDSHNYRQIFRNDLI